MGVLLAIMIPFLSIFLNIHYFMNYPESAGRGLGKAIVWTTGIFGVIILLAVTGHMD